MDDNEAKRSPRMYIDNKPVAEVDVSGMNLTLMCSITGLIPFKTRFKDAYECGWDNRGEVKAIINETIGAATPTTLSKR